MKSIVITLLGLFLFFEIHAAAPQASMRLAEQYLRQSQLVNGFFRYEFDLVSSRYSAKNNIVRQAGAAYGLSEFYQAFPADASRLVLKRTLGAFQGASIPHGGGFLITTENQPINAKAGATALALITELRYSKTSGDQSFAVLREQWLKGLMGLYKPGEGFASRPGVLKESDYSNGEIWLALAELAATTRIDTLTKKLLKNIDTYFMDHYAKNVRIGFFHWGVMAAMARYKHSGDKRFLHFASQQTDQFINQLRPNINQNSNSCYAVEGMVSLYQVLAGESGDQSLPRQLGRRIQSEMAKNMRLQIKPEAKRIVLSDGVFLYREDLYRFAGAFANGRLRPQLRIDATQHCLSALVKSNLAGISGF